MADLALDNALIDEYLKFKFQEDYTPDTIRKLFKYIQPFPLRESFFDDPSILMQLENDPLIEVVDNCTDEELVQNTLLKFMLVDKFSKKSYRILDINDEYEKLKPKYVGTYPNSIGKEKAQEHIKALLSDAKYVIITDGFITTQWKINKVLIKDIVPCRILNLKIIGANKDHNKLVIDTNEKEDLKLICNDWTIQASPLGKNIHDRYIETDKLKILLSSGLYNLSATSKDFTYVIEIK
ncbi:MAG: hypothetical protein QM493_05815 [Sulfurovum sp.]